MKTLKLMLAALAVMFIAVNAKADVKPTKLTKTDVVNMYIDAIAHGKTAGIDAIFDSELQYNVKRGDNVSTMDKDQVVSYLKGMPTDNQSVTTDQMVMQENDDTSVIKVTFKFADYTRTDVLTISSGNGWQITNVTSSTK